MGALVISNKQLPPAFPLLLNFLRHNILTKAQKPFITKVSIVEKKMCTQVDD
jgi:hypothetical protein